MNLFFFTELNFTTIEISLIEISLIGTYVSVRRPLMWEEAGVSGENLNVHSGDHHTFSHNHCPSWGSNSGCSCKKQVLCPLRYLDTVNL